MDLLPCVVTISIGGHEYGVKGFLELHTIVSLNMLPAMHRYSVDERRASSLGLNVSATNGWLTKQVWYE